MARKVASPDPTKLFEEVDRLAKAGPALVQSYSQFLQDLRKYRESHQPQRDTEEKTQDLNDYLIFGASFEKSL
jgi:hypothetical protein